MTELQRYDTAKRALAELVSVDEVKTIRDKALAIQEYARRACDKQMELDACRYRLQCERRAGELLAEITPASTRDDTGKFTNEQRKIPDNISRNQSSQWQQLASIPEGVFDKKVEALVRPLSAKVILSHGKTREIQTPPLPPGLYNLIYADPPWRYDFAESSNREIENQYPTMPLEAIMALQVPAAKDCVLFMWATSPKLGEAMLVVGSWGFTYRTSAAWVKDKIGMGYYFRQRHELLLVATKGSPGTPEPQNRPDSVIEAPRLAHSEKPDIHSLIEKMYPDSKKLELFSRRSAVGWDSWGSGDLESLASCG